MTDREKEILEILKKNPMISQNDLANQLGITRSSVAVHITNLLKKGYVEGKGYIVKEEPYVSIIGGTNIDIQGFSKNKIVFKDSNPGEVKTSLGGVGRNIGENLARLGVETKLISVIGDDVYGNKILDEARAIGLNMNDSLIMEGTATSTYLSILDENRDMTVAIAHMDTIDNMTVDFIKSKKHVVEHSKLCIIDTNAPKDVIEYIVTTAKDTSFFLDTVSTTKAKKVKDIIGYFHTIKPNKLEAEVLSGIKIVDEDSLRANANYFLDKGVKRVFISLGDEGVYYNDGNVEELVKAHKINAVNVTGAGDAFIAGLAYCYLNDFDLYDTTRFAMTVSLLAISHEETINPNMSLQNVKIKMEELNLC